MKHNISRSKHPRSAQAPHRSYSTLSLVLVILIGIVFVLQVVLVNDASLATAASTTTTGSLPGAFKGDEVQLAAATSSSQRKRRWAYVFLLADCDPTSVNDDTTLQPAYRGILYNIMAATFVLKYLDDEQDRNHDRSSNSKRKSQADIVVLVQMAATTTASRLLRQEEELLRNLNVTIRYLPRRLEQQQQTFYELVMAKFHVLSMVEYTKILFLDGDVLPLCNLDYLLELSEHEQGLLGDTVLHAMYDDPVNAGVFVVTPNSKQNNETTIFRQWNEFLALSPDQRPPVDYRLWKKGRGNSNKGSGWDFYCADSDQGFLLYWSLFLQDESQSISIIVGPTIEQYDAILPSSSSSSVSGLFQDRKRTVARRPTRVVSSQFLSDYSCLPPSPFATESSSISVTNPRSQTWAQNANVEAAQWPFYQDFYHMVGYSKAWESSAVSTPGGKKNRQDQKQGRQALASSHDFWYFVLQQVVDRFDPNHTVIPHPLERLSEFMAKPKLRGDLLFTIPRQSKTPW